MDTTAKRRGQGALALLAAPILLMLALPPVAGGARAATAVTPQGAAGGLMGDVNCSGVVDTVDALQILRLTAGLTTNAGCMAQAGDVDCSGGKDSVDSLRILRFVAGLVVQAPPGCTAIGNPLQLPPTSEELIKKALTDGKIDYETSLRYRAYAAFGDDRLPPEYQSEVIDIQALGPLAAEVHSHQSQLSSGLLEALAPFLSRPNDPISPFNAPGTLGAARSATGLSGVVPAAEQAGYWMSNPAAGGKIRVWARSDQATIDQVASFVSKVDQISPILDQLWTPAIPDEAGTPTPGINPDDAIDLYFVDPGSLNQRWAGCFQHIVACPYHEISFGAASTEPFTGNKSSGYAFITRQLSEPRLTSAIARALSSIRQDAYDYEEAEEEWLPISTETFAEWYVLKQLGLGELPHEVLPEFFSTLSTLPLGADRNVSAGYLYFFYQYLKRGHSPGVHDVWKKAEAEGIQGIDAADQAFPFEPNFHEFALRNWNRPPVDDWSKEDAIEQKAEPLNSPIVIDAPASSKLYADLTGLTESHNDFMFANDSIHSVVFKNTVAGQKGAGVRAVVWIRGQKPRVEDWSGIPEKTFCRDVPEQKVDELVIVISNSNPDPEQVLTPGDGPKLEAKAAGCSDWKGTITHKYRENFSTAFEFNSSADVVFKGDPNGHPPLSVPPNATSYVAVSGTVNWNSTLTFPDCVASGAGSYSVLDSDKDLNLRSLFIWDDGQPGLRYFGQGQKNEPPPKMSGCGLSSYEILSGSRWFSTGGYGPVQRVSADGTTISGSYDEPAVGVSETWTWDLHKAPP